MPKGAKQSSGTNATVHMSAAAEGAVRRLAGSAGIAARVSEQVA